MDIYTIIAKVAAEFPDDTEDCKAILVIMNESGKLRYHIGYINIANIEAGRIGSITHQRYHDKYINKTTNVIQYIPLPAPSIFHQLMHRVQFIKENLNK